MKVLIISTSESGGAYMSANRLACGLRKFGHEAVLVTRCNSLGSKPHKLKKFISKIVAFSSEVIARKPFEQISPVSVPYLDLNYVEKLKPDIVHIHNWFNFLSISQIEQLIRQYPVILTMHDARLLTGGCFFTFDCKGFLNGCAHCPAVFFPRGLIRNSRSKLSVVINMNRPHKVVFPSRWMQGEFESAYPEIRIKNNQVIPNMPNDIYLESTLNIPRKSGKRKVILFVASDITQPLKGLQRLLDVIGSFKDSVTLNIIGAGKIELSSESQKYINVLGNLSELELRAQFNIADALIVASLSENRPNIIVEAHLAGVFVLATNVGGIPEMVIDGITGILFSPTKDELHRAISNYLGMSESDCDHVTKKSYIEALEINNPAKIIEAHVQLYNDLRNEYFNGDVRSKIK